MFEYLCQKVKPSEVSAQVMVDKELPELIARLCGDSPYNDISRLCLEIDRCSPWLGKAVRAGGMAFINSYKYSYQDVPDELWSLFQVWSTASTLVVLRLIERELQAEDMAKRLGIANE